MTIWLTLSCLLFYLFLASAIQYAPEVQIQSGRIRGVLEQLATGDEVRKYLNITYADAVRFDKPAPPPSWKGVRDTIDFGKACFHSPRSPPFGTALKDMSEQCLNLNVYVPHKSSRTPLPVMVWIHGGGFRSNSNRVSDGSYLATEGEVIVVVINYRLGVFGFLATGSGPSDFKGNYGLMDQVKSLEWVNRNIKGFGGDPNRVTIFGNSAGGASVSLLCLSPFAKGTSLFQNAIMQSGVANTPMAAYPYDKVANLTKKFIRDVNCTDFANFKSCLKSQPIELIFNVSQTVSSPFVGVPVIDGYFIPELSTATTKVENGTERSAFVTLFTQSYPPIIVHAKAAVLPAFGEAMILRYTDWTNISNPFRNRRMHIDLLTDAIFIAPSIAHANAYAKKGGRTYYYQVEYKVNLTSYFHVPSWLRAYHEAEKFMIFGYPLKVKESLYTEEANFSRTVIQMWTNFAKTG
ncbi:hypothetical protein QZH41_016360 [Actinostola sp. cb2023]|nr:hypothetical protein QZH41_016360 [Actinostola sp. cb2023]